MDTKKKKKTTYRGVVTPPIEDAFLRGAALGRAITPKKRGSLKKEPMGPSKSLMPPRLEIRSKPMYDARVKYNKIPVTQTETIMSKPSKPRYGAGGTQNPKQPAKKKTVVKKRPVAKKKTEAQRRYEEQIKARKQRQKDAPLGTNTMLGRFGAKQDKMRRETGRKQINMDEFYGKNKK